MHRLTSSQCHGSFRPDIAPVLRVAPGETVTFETTEAPVERLFAAGDRWLEALDKLIALRPKTLVPGHGGASDTPMQDLTFTRDYLHFLRAEMGRAVDALTPFEEAYAATDWSRYQTMPAFPEANRPNAYNTYILLEKESVSK